MTHTIIKQICLHISSLERRQERAPILQTRFCYECIKYLTANMLQNIFYCGIYAKKPYMILSFADITARGQARMSLSNKITFG